MNRFRIDCGKKHFIGEERRVELYRSSIVVNHEDHSATRSGAHFVGGLASGVATNRPPVAGRRAWDTRRRRRRPAHLAIYLPDSTKPAGFGVVVCPGGGYQMLAMDHKGR